MLEQLKERRMVVVVGGLFCFIDAAGPESNWKAESVRAAKILLVLCERPGIPTVEMRCVGAVEVGTLRPFLQCGSPY